MEVTYEEVGSRSNDDARYIRLRTSQHDYVFDHRAVYRTPPAMLVNHPSICYTPKSVEELKLMTKKELIDQMQGACSDATINNTMGADPKAQSFPELRLKYMNDARKVREYMERVGPVVRSKYDPEPPWVQAYIRASREPRSNACNEGWELAKDDWAAELPKKSEAK